MKVIARAQRGRTGSGIGRPADVEISAAGRGLAREEAVDDSGHLHHPVVLAQIVLRLRQERVLPPVAPN